MIRRDKGELVCECNECGKEYYGGTANDFSEFVAELKDEGWQIRKVDDTWEHTCPECQE